MIRPAELIQRKRDGGELSATELTEPFRALSHHTVVGRKPG
jgi:hypothetical protein